jgi:hypothetical protein
MPDENGHREDVDLEVCLWLVSEMLRSRGYDRLRPGVWRGLGASGLPCEMSTGMALDHEIQREENAAWRFPS